MKAVTICGIVFIFNVLLYENRINAVDEQASQNGQAASPESESARILQYLVRVPMEEFELSDRLKRLKTVLAMDGIKKPLTDKQKFWIDRFKKTVNNWLYLVECIRPLDKYQEIYRKHLETYYDGWVTGRKSDPFEMTYELSFDRELVQTWNIGFFRISFDGFGLAEPNLKFDIHFERSKEKMKTPNGKLVYRKDRIYTFDLEVNIPTVELRFKHEIYGHGEEPTYNPLLYTLEQDTIAGIVRLRLYEVNLRLKFSYAEIDKRFVTEDSETGETYYYRVPEVHNFQFSVKGGAETYNPEYQYKPGFTGNFIGKDLDKGKAEKILNDFMTMFVSKEDNAEMAKRMKMALLNRFSEAVMVSEDITTLMDNFDAECSYYTIDIPVKLKPSDLQLRKEAFYMSYSISNLVLFSKHCLFDDSWKNKSAEEQTKEGREFLKGQVKEVDSTKLSIYDDGFDWEEDELIEQAELRGDTAKEEPKTEVQDGAHSNGETEGESVASADVEEDNKEKKKKKKRKKKRVGESKIPDQIITEDGRHEIINPDQYKNNHSSTHQESSSSENEHVVNEASMHESITSQSV